MTCKTCQNPFESSAVSFAIAGVTVSLSQSICDPCQHEYEADLARQSRGSIMTASKWEDICPPCYRGFDLELLPESSKAIARKALGWEDSAKGVGLVGPSRSGKTFILFELMRRLHGKGCRVKATSGTDFAYACGSPDQDERRKMIDGCINAELLYLDDIDKMRMTDRVESDFYRVIEERRRWLKPVFVTLNATGKDLAGMLSATGGTPIVNRLRHDVCEFYAI